MILRNRFFGSVFLLLAVCAVLAGFVSCRQKKETEQNKNGKINVTVTVFPPYDFARQVAKDRINLVMLLPPGTESHSFEPSPRDIITIQNSDIFIYSGGESDKWIDRILNSMDAGKIKILSMIKAVEALEEEIVEGMESDDNDDSNNEETPYDEHVWTSPANAKLLLQAITNLLCETDTVNSEFYSQNAHFYMQELENLDIAFNELVSGAKRKTVVFGDRFPFRYLFDAYNLDYYAAFPGCSTETEPSAATVAFLIKKVRDENIPVVFHIELSNERMANTISAESGAKKLLLHSCHNLTKREFDSGTGYLEIQRRNIENLKEALY